MQRRIAVLALALLTVTAGCSALPGNAANASGATDAAQAQVSDPAVDAGQTVTVAAGGQVRTAPDRAVVRVAVTARADAVETVRARLAENASRMRRALGNAGVDGDQITSARYDIGRNYEHRDRPSAPRFQGQHAFVVTLNDTDRAGDVVVTAVQNGATNVEEVRFTITPETRRDLRERALSRAVDNARGKATVAADGTGLTLAGVRTVRTGDVSVQPDRPPEYAFATAADAGGGTSFESGEVTVTAQVTVVYNATEE